MLNHEIKVTHFKLNGSKFHGKAPAKWKIFVLKVSVSDRGKASGKINGMANEEPFSVGIHKMGKILPRVSQFRNSVSTVSTLVIYPSASPPLGPKSQNSPCEKLSNCFACTEKSCNVTIFQLTHLLCNFYTLDLIYSTPESKSTVQGFCMIIFYGCLADKHLLYGSQ